MESLCGDDSVQLDSRVLADFAAGDFAKFDTAGDISTVKLSKNGNIVYALNNSGFITTFTLKIIAGGSDDKYINSRLVEFKNNTAAFVLFSGVFCKRVGNGLGGVTNVVYQVNGGVPKKVPGVVGNSEGAAEQAYVTWEFTFGNIDRSIQ